MVLLRNCTACQMGDHARHVEHYRPVPDGVMGGAACPCKGECQGKPEPDPQVDAMVEAMTRMTGER